MPRDYDPDAVIELRGGSRVVVRLFGRLREDASPRIGPFWRPGQAVSGWVETRGGHAPHRGYHNPFAQKLIEEGHEEPFLGTFIAYTEEGE